MYIILRWKAWGDGWRHLRYDSNRGILEVELDNLDTAREKLLEYQDELLRKTIPQDEIREYDEDTKTSYYREISDIKSGIRKYKKAIEWHECEVELWEKRSTKNWLIELETFAIKTFRTGVVLYAITVLVLHFV